MTQPDMNQLLEQAQQMQAQLHAAQQEILDTKITGDAGNGLVKITMTGGGTVEAVAIDPKVVDPEDVETLQDLIVAALGDAQAKIGALAEEKLGPISAAMGGGLF